MSLPLQAGPSSCSLKPEPEGAQQGGVEGHINCAACELRQEVAFLREVGIVQYDV